MTVILLILAKTQSLLERFLAFSLLLVLLTGGVCAQTPHYPELTGRVVDQAHVVDAATAAAMTDKLRDLEEKSSIQMAVVTVSSLEGLDIETYANTLFRKWKLGQAKDDNGLLFVFAIGDRKMRLEVGRGLEGVMTDALSRVIEQTAIIPAFKKGDYADGVSRGVDAVIAALSVDKEGWKPKPAPTTASDSAFAGLLPALLVIFFFFVVIRMMRGAARRGGGNFIILPGPPMGGGFGGGFGGSNWGGGGGADDFSGGGGDSGGGGASSEW